MAKNIRNGGRGQRILSAAASAAVAVTWNNAVPPGNWSSTASWSGAGITGLPGAGDAVVFGGIGSSTTQGTLTNDVDTDFTIASLQYTQKTNLLPAQYHTTKIDDGKTLLVSGTGTSFFVGTGVGDDINANIYTTINGNGTLSVNNAAATFSVRQGMTTNSTGGAGLRATLDMSALANFNANVSVVQIGVGGGSAANFNRAAGTFFGATSNTFTAGTMTVGLGTASQAATPGSQLFLGQTNVLNVGLLDVGDGRATGSVNFNKTISGGTLVIRAADGVGRANVSLGLTQVNDATTSQASGTMDLTSDGGVTRGSGSIDALLATLEVGRGDGVVSTGNNGRGLGRLTYNAGTVDANTVILGEASGTSATATGVGNGTLEVLGSGQLVVNGNMMLGKQMPTPVAGVPVGTLTIGGVSSTASARVAGDIVDGGGTSNVSVTNATLSASHVGSPTSPIDTLTLGAATFKVAIGANPGAVITSLVVNSATTLGVNLTATPTPGTYTLIDYTGSITGSGSGFSSFSLQKLPARMNAHLVDNSANTSVDLVVDSYDTPRWTGLDNGVTPNNNWDINTTHNWTLVNAATVTTYQEDLATYSTTDSVLFNDLATGAGAVSINVAQNVAPSLMTVDASRDYSFSGSGGIRGGVPITKSSSGTLTLVNTGGNVLGAITVNAGTVQIGDNATANSGAMTATSISLASGATFIFNQPDANAFTGVISGSGSIVHSGSGTTMLSGTNTYAGNTTISNGTVKATNNGSLGALPGGTVTISGTGSLDVGGFSTADAANFGQKQFNISGAGPSAAVGVLTNSSSVNRQINVFQKVTLTGDATIGGPGRFDVRSPTATPTAAQLDLAGFTLTKVGTGTFGLVRADATPGNIHIVGGILNIEASSNITGAGTITIDAGTTGQFNNYTGTTSRDIALNGGTLTDVTQTAATTVASNINLGAASTLNAISPGGLMFTGVISGAVGAGVTKTGTGLLVLSGANTYSGVTIVNSGTLSVGSSSNLGDASATNSIAFGGGATLLATGTINSAGRSIALSAAGTINTNGSDAIFGAVDGTGAFTKTGAGSLTVNHVVSGNLTVNAGTLTMVPDSSAVGVSHVAGLSIVGAKLDLGANKLITTTPVGAVTGATYAGGNLYDGVTGMIQSGRGNPTASPTWGGPSGIITSQTAATGGNLTSIGVAKGSEAKGISATDTAVWAGQTVTGSDTLVMYTYGGDANLDGKINVDDYGRIDFAVPLGIAGWSNGDFNYDGKINVDDYGIIDFNVGIQGPPFPAGEAIGATGISAVTAVPEPGALSLLVLGGATMLIRRRRRRRR